MTLTSGTRLGPYEILSALGAGGMGEVYRARDTKLNRDVAIKVLPEVVATDPERLARFHREAQVLASLNHPNIAAIYGFEDANAADALIMELVEGPTLADRIARGPIPLNEALPIAKQIAEALESAHEQGIIHRDLKPANIKVREDGTVKVLDFGLAKLIDVTTPGSGSLSMSPTLSLQATMAGVLLGTAAYMAPEQARGKPADRRADIWAFGVVLFEMLTGNQPFPGEDISHVLARVIEREPDWNVLPPATPQGLRRLLTRCLKKDPKERLQAIGDARIDIAELLSRGPETEPVEAPTVVITVPRARRVLPWTVAGVLGVTLATVVALWAPWRTVEPAPPIRFAIVPPTAESLAATNTDRQLAISPDGLHVAYVAAGGQLLVRSLDRLDGELLRGVTNARFPFFSPDGKWVGYFQGTTELKKVSLTGGPPLTICRINQAPRGASWGSDDIIVFATADLTTGLLSVAAGGGEPKVLTKPDAARGEQDHLFPSVLPGARAVLLTISVPGQADTAQVAVLDLKSGQRKILVRGGGSAEYVETGHLVYVAAGSLRAVGFDPVGLNVLSDPVPIADQVATVVTTGAAEFSVSRAGTLVYVPADRVGRFARRSLVWVSRQGQEEPINAPLRAYTQARLSPDDSRIALDVRDQDNDIWVWDIAHQTLTRLTFDATQDDNPVWTPDGRRIAFRSGRLGVTSLFWQMADGTGTAERLLATSASNPFTKSFTPDGKLIFQETHPNTAADLMILTVDGHSQPEPLVATGFGENNGVVSPDGRWLAYQSNDSGQVQIYVRPFPKVDDGRWQVSSGGGFGPVWASNGRELFFTDAEGNLLVAPVQAAATFSVGNVTRVFANRYYWATANAYRAFDVSHDGQRFVMIKEGPDQSAEGTPANMVVVLNWSEALKRLVPTK